MPSSGETSGRSGEAPRELDNGTTTSSSPSTPAEIASAETTIAGRFLPGSPLRLAPSETSQISPRRGSADAVPEGRLPLALLGPHGLLAGVTSGRFALGLEDRLAIRLAHQLGHHRGKRDSALTCLRGK